MKDELETFRLMRKALQELRDASGPTARNRTLLALIAALSIQVGLTAMDNDRDNDGVPDSPLAEYVISRKKNAH